MIIMLFVILYLNHRQWGKGKKAEGYEGGGRDTGESWIRQLLKSFLKQVLNCQNIGKEGKIRKRNKKKKLQSWKDEGFQNYKI